MSGHTGSQAVIIAAEAAGWTVNDERRNRRLLQLRRGEIHVEVWTTRAGGVSLVTIYRQADGGMRNYRDLPRQVSGRNKAAQLIAVIESGVS